MFNSMLSYIIISAKNKLNCFVRNDVFLFAQAKKFGVHFDLFFILFCFVFFFPPLSM